MRIVAGTFGGRKLIVPKGHDIRPTSDKIRGAIMNMLISRGAIDGAHVMDAFCGTGALGLEAISRGAASCVFMDSAGDSLNLAKENAKALAIEATFLLKDATKIGPLPQSLPPVDLLFLDPPYGKGLVVPSLEALRLNNWLSPHAWILCENEIGAKLEFSEYFIEENQKNYSDTKITLLKYKQ